MKVESKITFGTDMITYIIENNSRAEIYSLSDRECIFGIVHIRGKRGLVFGQWAHNLPKLNKFVLKKAEHTRKYAPK